jgi:UDP-glucose 4-epimerase
MRILVTGGAGYIGTHTLVSLLSKEHEICVVDNYANSSPIALDRVRRLTNYNFEQHELDIGDSPKLSGVFAQFQPEAVIHFAGLKAVGASERDPLLYYNENVGGAISLLRAMDAANCRQIVFSSSATVYGEPLYLPYDEKHTLAPINPYGRTKFFIEEIIKDWTKTADDKKAILLRYFNPVGAHSSGDIGEDPDGIPNNLLPFISQVAVGRREHLNIFGDDYDTRDGTGIRDYIHVSDLADGHAAAFNYFTRMSGVEIFNLGTGNGISVLEMVEAYKKASGKDIPYNIAPRRDGDLPAYWAEPKKANELLGWSANYTLDDICRDSWLWQSKNPEGYK